VGAGLLAAPVANAATIVLGGNYGSLDVLFNGTDASEGTGSINPSTLNGSPVSWVYCLDLEHDINVPGTYQANVTTNGTVTEASYGPVNLNATLDSGSKSGGVVQLTFTTAGQIAYLLDHYANSATTLTQQEALQGAIWKEIYGSAFSLGSGATSAQTADYNAYLTGVGTDPVSNEIWLSPYNSSNVYQQALVTDPVPEPGAVAMFVGAGVAGLGLLSRKRRRSTLNG